MKASLKSWAARTLRGVSMWSGDALRRARAVRRPRILMYHAIGPDDVPPDVFEWQLDCLMREFELVSLQELGHRLRQGQVSGNEVVITFDDGVLNHASTAYPILRAKGACATFFVCPGLAASGRWIWNMELRLRLRLLSASERRTLAMRLGATDAEVETMIAWAKQQRLPVRNELESLVAAATRQFEPNPAEIDRHAPMDWEQLKQLDQRVVTIGSHSVSHPILTALGAAEQEAEITGSRDWLREQLQREVDLFCYPNGENDEDAVACVRRTYAAAVTTRPGFVAPDDDIVLLPRIDAGGTPALFLRQLHRPRA